jgi:hypothetical protein
MAPSNTLLRTPEGIEFNRSVHGKANIDRVLKWAVALNCNGLTQADERTAMQVNTVSDGATLWNLASCGHRWSEASGI